MGWSQAGTPSQSKKLLPDFSIAEVDSRPHKKYSIRNNCLLMAHYYSFQTIEKIDLQEFNGQRI